MQNTVVIESEEVKVQLEFCSEVAEDDDDIWYYHRFSNNPERQLGGSYDRLLAYKRFESKKELKENSAIAPKLLEFLQKHYRYLNLDDQRKAKELIDSCVAKDSEQLVCYCGSMLVKTTGGYHCGNAKCTDSSILIADNSIDCREAIGSS